VEREGPVGNCGGEKQVVSWLLSKGDTEEKEESNDKSSVSLAFGFRDLKFIFFTIVVSAWCMILSSFWKPARAETSKQQQTKEEEKRKKRGKQTRSKK
jgi:hypothetical protein